MGILITAGIAILAGLIIGILVKVINKNGRDQQFNDEEIYDDIPIDSTD